MKYITKYRSLKYKPSKWDYVKIIWDNSKEVIIAGAIFLGGAATEKYIRNLR